MKKLNKVSVATLVFISVFVLVGSVVFATIAPGGVDLGTAEEFAVFADDAITDANPPTGIITGNVGLTPTTGASITGLTCAQVTGTIYDVDGAYGDICEIADAVLLTSADNDLSTAYNFAEAQLALPDIATELGGQVITPGVYHSAAGTFSISGGTTLTLDANGDPDAVFIFQTDSTLSTIGASNSVVLADGAQACNVFWKVGTSATLDTTTTFVGTIMAAVSITDAGGSTIVGRLLADADETDVPETGAVSLNNTTVTVPSCAPSLSLVKTVTNDDGGTALDTAWTLTATGTGGAPTNLSGTTPVDSNITFADATFEADTYTLAESGGPSGYTAGTYSCVTNGGGAVVGNSITLASGDDAVCTIHNNDDAVVSSGGSGSSGSVPRNRTTLRIIKQVINDDGGVSHPSFFAMHVTSAGVDVSGSPASGVVAPGRLYNLSSGTYVVSEDPTDTYAQSFGGDCDADGSVTLSTGDDKTCIVINDDIAAATATVTTTLAPATPGFPATGFPPKESKNVVPIIIFAAICIVSSFIYFARKKQTQ